MMLLSRHRTGCDCANRADSTESTHSNCCDECEKVPCCFTILWECCYSAPNGEYREPIAFPCMRLQKDCVQGCTWTSRWYGGSVDPRLDKAWLEDTACRDFSETGCAGSAYSDCCCDDICFDLTVAGWFYNPQPGNNCGVCGVDPAIGANGTYRLIKLSPGCSYWERSGVQNNGCGWGIVPTGGNGCEYEVRLGNQSGSLLFATTTITSCSSTSFTAVTADGCAGFNGTLTSAGTDLACVDGEITPERGLECCHWADGDLYFPDGQNECDDDGAACFRKWTLRITSGTTAELDLLTRLGHFAHYECSDFLCIGQSTFTMDGHSPEMLGLPKCICVKSVDSDLNDTSCPDDAQECDCCLDFDCGLPVFITLCGQETPTELDLTWSGDVVPTLPCGVSAPSSSCGYFYGSLDCPGDGSLYFIFYCTGENAWDVDVYCWIDSCYVLQTASLTGVECRCGGIYFDVSFTFDGDCPCCATPECCANDFDDSIYTACCPALLESGRPATLTADVRICAEDTTITMTPEGVMAPRYYRGTGTITGNDVTATFWMRSCTLCISVTPTGGGLAQTCCIQMSGICDPVDLAGENLSCSPFGMCIGEPGFSAIITE